MILSELMKSDAGGEKKFRIEGAAVGVVTDINDPLDLGRVKVKLITRDTSEFETDYIRIITFMIGDEWGSYFIPEIGDEVLVIFAEGDITRPYVLGSLRNKNTKPPEKIKDSKNDIRKIKTRSGHEIIFNDEKDKESIELKTPKKLTVKMEDEKELITITDKDGNNLVKIDSKNGIVNVLAEKKISVKTGNASMEMDGGSNTVTIEGQQSLTLKGQQVTIDAKSSVNIKASSNVSIKADGPINIKGAMVKLN